MIYFFKLAKTIVFIYIYLFSLPFEWTLMSLCAVYRNDSVGSELHTKIVRPYFGFELIHHIAILHTHTV